jgi:protein tyrosine/serine phosphatase
VSKRSLFLSLICTIVVIGFVTWIIRRNSAISANEVEASQHTTVEARTAPLTDSSAEVAATLPYFHRLNDEYIRGAEPARGGIETLRRLGVKTIVDLRSDYDYTETLKIAADQYGLNYYRAPMSVWNPPTDKEARDFVKLVSDKTKAPFYVFCADGLNRVGEMSAIYRISHDRWTPQQALKEIDEFGFNPYYYTLRNYVWTYARKFYPKSLPPQARSLSQMELTD